MLYYLLVLSRTILIVTFVFALASKLLDISKFERTISEFQFISHKFTKISAYLVLIIEALTIFLLVNNKPFLIWGFSLAILMLIIFSIILRSTLKRNLQVPCDCFGSTKKNISIYEIWRNISLILLGVLGILTGLPLQSIPNLSLIEQGFFSLVAIAIAFILVNFQEIALIMRPSRH